MNEIKTMHLFAGVGGGILADLILGHRPIVAVEWDKYACKVLRERVADGWFEGMSVWEGDVQLFDPSEYKGRVDCIHAGFPCQDISVAGNQAGVGEDSRSGLYREVLRIADEIQPEYIFLENVAAIVTGCDGEWLRTVVGDLASRGYDAVWICLSASEVGAWHKRDRWWLLAFPYASSDRLEDGNKQHGREGREVFSRISDNGYSFWGEAGRTRGVSSETNVSDTECKRGCSRNTQWKDAEAARKLHRGEGRNARTMGFWDVESNVGRVANGIPNRAHRLKGLGNAQVPLQAATAFSLLWEIKNDKN